MSPHVHYGATYMEHRNGRPLGVYEDNQIFPFKGCTPRSGSLNEQPEERERCLETQRIQ